MANYTKRTWQARIAIGDNKFKDTNTGQSFTFIPTPDTVTQYGTPFEASYMNNIEDGVEMANNPVDVKSGFSITPNTSSIVDAFKCGGWCIVRVGINFDTALASGGEYSATLTFPTGCTPLMTVQSESYYSTNPLFATLESNGTIKVHNVGSSSISSGRSARFCFIYPRG